ncbi:MAG: outer membrane protein assembly factor BamE [Sneathiellaceae bacterium]
MLKTLAVAALLLLPLAAAGCTPRISTHGAIFTDEEAAKIEPGRQTQAEVEQILGSPSVTATFKQPEDTWYYISSEFEAYGIFKPEPTRRRVLAVNFDDSLRVREVAKFELEDGQEIAMVERETPTRGKELNFLQQLFGNLGRFNNVSPTADKR